MKTSKIRVNENINVRPQDEQDKINDINKRIYSFLIEHKILILQEFNGIIHGVRRDELSKELAKVILNEYEKNKNF